ESTGKPPLPGNSVGPGKPPTEPGKEPPKVPVAKGSNAKTLALQFLVGTAATMAGASILKEITAGFSSPAATSSPSPATQNPPSDSYAPTYSSGSPGPQYGQYQNQQRAVDHGKRADFFGEPHSGHDL
ncbi:hypothetical protein V8E52_010476, partial [Russula decolorans]